MSIQNPNCYFSLRIFLISRFKCLKRIWNYWPHKVFCRLDVCSSSLRLLWSSKDPILFNSFWTEHISRKYFEGVFLCSPILISFLSPLQNCFQTTGILTDYHSASLHKDALTSVYVTIWKICILAMNMFVWNYFTSCDLKMGGKLRIHTMTILHVLFALVFQDSLNDFTMHSGSAFSNKFKTCKIHLHFLP